jgi:hypothetical protein
MPGALDGSCQGTLVFGADTGLAPGLDLPAVGHVSAEPIGILVVNELDVIDAEAADLSTAVVARSAAPAAESAATTTTARSSTGSTAARSPAWSRPAGPTALRS